MSDLGEEFAKKVFNVFKKHLHDLYNICVLTAFRPSFPHLETLKKILENSTLSRYVKKNIKKIFKKSRPTDPIFKFWSGEGNITIFFFWPYDAVRICDQFGSFYVLSGSKYTEHQKKHHFFRMMITKIHHIKINHIWTQISFNTS